MRITTNTTPTQGGQSEYWLNHLVVVIAAGKRPASIPNLEAKPASADGTAPGRVWESRTPPQQPLKGGALGTHVPRAPPFTYTHKKNKKRDTRRGPYYSPRAAPFFCVSTSCYNTARVNTRPVVSEHHAYARNAVTIESAHGHRVIAPPAHPSANTHLMCFCRCILLQFRS